MEEKVAGNSSLGNRLSFEGQPGFNFAWCVFSREEFLRRVRRDSLSLPYDFMGKLVVETKPES